MRTCMCHVCDSQAVKYFKYQEELRRMEEVVKKFSHLTNTNEGRRRSSAGASTASKRYGQLGNCKKIM